MSKKLVVLSTEEKVIIRRILGNWIQEQESRGYLSDKEYRDLNTMKRCYYNKFKNQSFNEQ